MSIQYQRNLNSNIYPNYNKTLQYNTLIPSPQKNSDNNIFNYGMKHYYSAEINSSKKVSHNHNPKPVYILNPQFIANHINHNINHNINQNILYSIPYNVHTADIQRRELNKFLIICILLMNR